MAPFTQDGGGVGIKTNGLELNHLGVLLLLDGSDSPAKQLSKVKKQIDQVLETDWNEEETGTTNREKGVYETFDDLYEEKILPGIESLANTVTDDLTR